MSDDVFVAGFFKLYFNFRKLHHNKTLPSSPITYAKVFNSVSFFNVMASGGFYSSIYITTYSLINYLCALNTTLGILNT